MRELVKMLKLSRAPPPGCRVISANTGPAATILQLLCPKETDEAK